MLAHQLHKAWAAAVHAGLVCRMLTLEQATSQASSAMEAGSWPACAQVFIWYLREALFFILDELHLRAQGKGEREVGDAGFSDECDVTMNSEQERQYLSEASATCQSCSVAVCCC